MSPTRVPPPRGHDQAAGLVGGIVLAAGAGTRFGGPKAVAVLDGERLAERAAALLRAAGCAPVVVVVGAEAVAVETALDVGPATIVRNPDWATGMGSSLRAGLRALGGRCGAAVVALADQPIVSAVAVERLIGAWHRGAAAAVATYAGEPRNPVLLDAALWPAVAERAVGDAGARTFLRDRPDLVTGVPCDDVGLPDDIDTPDDLVAAAAALRRASS